MSYFDMFVESYQTLAIETLENLKSDLENGYPFQGDHAKKELAYLEGLIRQYEEKMEEMDELELDATQIERYCRRDLKKRGWIE